MDNKYKALACALALTGCSAVCADEVKLDAFYFDLSNEFINSLHKNIDSCANEKGVKVKTHNAADDLMLQSQQIDSAINSRSVNLLLNLVDTSYAYNVADGLKDKDSRVIFVNRLPDKKVLESFEHAAFIGTDPSSSGYYQVEILKDYIAKGHKVDTNGNGKIDIVLLKGEVDHQDTRDRTQALFNGLKENKIDFNIVHVEYANWGFQQGYDAMDRAIIRNGYDKIELIVGNNDAMALGAIARLNEDKYNIAGGDKTIPVIGIDAIKEAVDAVKSGTMIGTVCNDSQTMARVAIDLFTMPDMDLQALKDKYDLSVEGRVITVPYSKITKE